VPVALAWVFAAAVTGACSPAPTGGGEDNAPTTDAADAWDASSPDSREATDRADATVELDARPNAADGGVQVPDAGVEDADAEVADGRADAALDGAGTSDAAPPDSGSPLGCGQAVVTQGRVAVRLDKREGAPTTVLDFTGHPAKVSARHRIDVDNGGCISEVLVQVSLNDRGCSLALRFGRQQDQVYLSAPDMMLIGASIKLDGFCPGIPDDREGVYGGWSVRTAALTPFAGVSDPTAPEACISRTLGIEGELTTSRHGGTSFEEFVTYSLQGFRLQGTLKSVGAGRERCTCSPADGCALCGERVEPSACGTCKPPYFGALCAYRCPEGESPRPCAECMSGFRCNPRFTELSVGREEVCGRRGFRPAECWSGSGAPSFTAREPMPLKTGDRYRCAASSSSISCGETTLQPQFGDSIRTIRDFDVRDKSYCVTGELRSEGGRVGLSCRGSGALALDPNEAWFVHKIAMGPRHVCGITNSVPSHLKCDGPGVRELGIARYTERFGSARAASIASGGIGTCVVFEGGGVRCVGPAATILPEGTRALSVAVGQRGVCAALSDGALRCFADERLTNVPEGRFHTVALGGPDDRPIACAIRDEGEIRCWGPGVDAGLVPAQRD
jgi:hypothetical protein